MECKVSELVKRGHDQAAELKSSCGGAVAQLISDLATQLDVQLARSNALVAENAGLKESRQRLAEFIHEELDANYPLNMNIEIPATDAYLAEVRAHDLNAFIRHHSAELDAHIKNGGEQLDEKSVRIRDIIVSARLFREQIRKEAAQ